LNQLRKLGKVFGLRQFFINHIATSRLHGKHAVFGQVTQGQDVVNATQQGDQLKSVTIAES